MITEEIYEKQGYRLHTYQTKKFQTLTFYFRFLCPLGTEFTNVSQLLPYVLLQGSKKFPDKNAIQNELDRLSGAILFAQVNKKSDFQVISFCLELLNPELAAEGKNILEDGLRLLENILYHPKMQNGQFVEGVVEQEKNKAIARLQNEMDNKIQYATNRMIEILFQGLPYGVPASGTIDALKEISPQKLTNYYQSFFQKQQVEIYVLGDIKETPIDEIIAKYFGTYLGEQSNFYTTDEFQVQMKPLNQEDIIEQEKIAQGKLHLGFETGITFSNKDYETLQVFNGIFGAYPHSKCFLTVREKYSLAYYVTSKFESHHGFLTVMTGIDTANEKKARETILAQLKQIQEGNITEKELQQTKAALKNELLCALDDPRGILDLGFHQVLAHHEKSFATWLENIEKVTTGDVIRASEQIRYMGSFFLKGEES